MEEDRVILRVKSAAGDWDPRITGKKRTFYGIVGFKRGFIPMENIEVIKL